MQLETSLRQVQVEAPHWQWACSLSLTRTAQVGHIVIASFSQVDSQSVKQAQSGLGAGHLQSLSDWQQPQLYQGSRYARALHSGCTSANKIVKIVTLPYSAIALLFNLIQY